MVAVLDKSFGYMYTCIYSLSILIKLSNTRYPINIVFYVHRMLASGDRP